MTSLLRFLCLCFLAHCAICASIPEAKHLENINPGTRTVKSKSMDLVEPWNLFLWVMIFNFTIRLVAVLYCMFQRAKGENKSYWTNEWKRLYMKTFVAFAELTGWCIIKRDVSAVQANQPTVIGPVFTFIWPWVELGLRYLWEMVLIPLYLAISNAIKMVYPVLKPHLQQSFDFLQRRCIPFLSKYSSALFWCIWSLFMAYNVRRVYMIIKMLISPDSYPNIASDADTPPEIKV